jgi:hypothetical protein
MIKFNRTAVTYDTPRKECPETIRQWPGCETVAGIQLIRDNSPAGFSAKITLYGRADKKVADRAMICVQREKRRPLSLDRMKIRRLRWWAGRSSACAAAVIRSVQ